MPTPGAITKQYTTNFSIEGMKLLRVVETIRGKFLDIQREVNEVYEVSLKSGKLIVLQSIDAVLNLDNRIQDPIVSLSVSIIGENEPATDSLASPRCMTILSNTSNRNVWLYVQGADNVWANQTFMEVEEQLQRSFSVGLSDRVKNGLISSPLLSGIIMLMVWLVVLLAFLITNADVLGGSAVTRTPATSLYSELERIVQQASEAESAEERQQLVFEYAKLETEWWFGLYDEPNSEEISISAFILRNTLVFLPLLSLIGGLVYLLVVCYPRAAFVWGDYAEHYSELVERRKNVWYGIIVAFFVNIATGVLTSSLLGVI